MHVNKVLFQAKYNAAIWAFDALLYFNSTSGKTLDFGVYSFPLQV